MEFRTRVRFGWIAVLALCAGALPAAAGSFDFLFSMDKVHNDTQYFLNLAVSNYGYQRPVLEPLLPRMRYVESDLPVFFYLQQASGWPLPQLIDLRARGASWSVIFTHVGVPQSVLFEGIPDDPGPPYGKAWGYWRNSPRGARLSDHDVCGLASIQVASRLTGGAPYDLARGYAHGMSAPIYVADKKGRPYHAAKGGPPPGQGAKKGQGHGHGQGKPKPH